MACLTGAAGFSPRPEIVLAAMVNAAADHQGWADRSRATLASLGGRWQEIPYRTAWGEDATYHVVDAELLLRWLRHPDFRMPRDAQTWAGGVLPRMGLPQAAQRVWGLRRW